MTASWFYPPTEPWRVQGRGLAEDNFAQEERSSLEILIREALQNPLDARADDNAGPVRVAIRKLSPNQVDGHYLEKLVDPEYRSRLDASLGDQAMLNFGNGVLLIEDFGTTGLLGTFTDSNADGNRENWNAFWFREGEGAKSGSSSNGRAGQGKITYYRIGAARAVFGLTIRESDGKALLLGRSSFRRMYQFKGIKYERDAFWCLKERERVLPVQEPDHIEQFRIAFRLRRQNEPGLSLVIPLPTEFEDIEAVCTVLSEFYFPIAKGRLEVKVGDTEITAENVSAIADQYLREEVVQQKGSSFTKGFRQFIQKVIEDIKAEKTPAVLNPGWEKTATLTESSFPTGTLETLRNELEKGERIAVRCPLMVKSKKGPPAATWVDLFLQVPDELARVEEAYIRGDLLIGSELHLASTTYLQKARGLTLIGNPPLSAFLADAEEPTHLKWNASRPRLAEDYRNPKEVVRAIRQALPRVLAFLSGGIVKRDIKALAKYFARPVDDGTSETSGGKDRGKKETKPTVVVPKPKRKPFLLETGRDWVSVRPNGSAAPKQDELPVSCTLEIAYEGLDQDPFNEYDPFDFDVSDLNAHHAATSGATIKSRSGNLIEFDVLDPNFDFKVEGFDSSIRLRARLTYKEREDGATVSAE